MRPIKFRVFDTKSKQYLDLETATIGMDPFNGRLFIYETESCESPIKAVDESRYILEQLTGLLDRNGCEIYEGDILQRNDKTYTVFYSQKDASFALKTKTRYGYNVYFSDTVECTESVILGNIHENPELL